MSDTVNFLRSMQKELAGDIHCAMLAKIEKFDHETMKADVKPLQKGVPFIQQVPVALQKAGPFYIRVPYAKGDIVIIVFADRGIDGQILTGDEQEPIGSRQHDLTDAIIVGGIVPWQAPVSGDHEDDLVISLNDQETKVVIKETGDVEIVCKNVDVHCEEVSVQSDDVTVNCGNASVNGDNISIQGDQISLN